MSNIKTKTERERDTESERDYGFTESRISLEMAHYASRSYAAHRIYRSLFSLPDLCVQTMHAVRFKPYLYFYEEDSNRHQENKKPLKWLRLWSRHWMLYDDTGGGGILAGFGARPRAGFGRYGGETPAQWRERGL